MIIDIHAHLYSSAIIGEGYWNNWVKLGSALSGKPEEKIRQRLPDLWDETGDNLIADMNAAGIDYSVIHVLDYGLTKYVGEADKTIRQINELYARTAEKYPDRLISFAGTDPRRKDALEIIKSAVTEYHMKGIKLLPGSGFYPNDKICYPIYEFAMNNDLPVFIHTGPTPAPLYSRFCAPIYLDDVANDFPDLKIIMGHAGSCWWPEALSVAGNKANVYLDLAAWQTRVKTSPMEEFYKPLKVMLSNIGSGRILFGSDWAAFRLYMSSQKWVNAFKNPPQEAIDAGLAPSEAEVNNILGNTAAMLLKIKQ